MSFLAGIAALAQPILSRILIAIGMSVVTMAGGAAVLGTMKSLLLTYISQAPAEALQIAGLAGVWTGLGLIFGAITFTATMWGLTKSVRLAVGT